MGLETEKLFLRPSKAAQLCGHKQANALRLDAAAGIPCIPDWGQHSYRCR